MDKEQSKCFHNGIILIVNCFLIGTANIQHFTIKTIIFLNKFLSLHVTFANRLIYKEFKQYT